MLFVDLLKSLDNGLPMLALFPLRRLVEGKEGLSGLVVFSLYFLVHRSGTDLVERSFKNPTHDDQYEDQAKWEQMNIKITFSFGRSALGEITIHTF